MDRYRRTNYRYAIAMIAFRLVNILNSKAFEVSEREIPRRAASIAARLLSSLLSIVSQEV